jgi:drug/metabolite transporter (DMT)-like permease
MTYAYVNPVIAVVLGRILLDEPVTGATALGATLIMAGIYGVFRDQRRRPA